MTGVNVVPSRQASGAKKSKQEEMRVSRFLSRGLKRGKRSVVSVDVLGRNVWTEHRYGWKKTRSGNSEDLMGTCIELNEYVNARAIVRVADDTDAGLNASFERFEPNWGFDGAASTSNKRASTGGVSCLNVSVTLQRSVFACDADGRTWLRCEESDSASSDSESSLSLPRINSLRVQDVDIRPELADVVFGSRANVANVVSGLFFSYQSDQ